MARAGASRSPAGGRDLLHDRVQQVGHALAGLGRDPEHVRRVAADHAGDLGRVLLRLRGRQVDLVQHRDQVQVGVERQVQVGQGLRLDALRGVHQQDRALAGGQGPGHLVGEVHVARGVDQVQHVLAAVPAPPGQADGLALDRDAALALDVHPVQVLRAHLPLAHDAGELQHPVRERGLAVIDMGDDAEIADHRLIGTARLGHGWLLPRTRSSVRTGSTCALVGPLSPSMVACRSRMPKPAGGPAFVSDARSISVKAPALPLERRRRAGDTTAGPHGQSPTPARPLGQPPAAAGPGRFERPGRSRISLPVGCPHARSVLPGATPRSRRGGHIR